MPRDIQSRSVIQIKSKIRDYTVAFPETADFVGDLERFPHHCYVIDENVWRLHREGCLHRLNPSDVIVQSVTEELKNLTTVQELYDRLLERSAKRNLVLVTVGGGIVQDITGFVASTLYRGINWVYVPTTLLAQADSCIGGKTSLNYRGFKNLLGTFYPPSQVFVYIPFLETLGETEFFSGLGEIVKLHIIAGAEKAEECRQLLPRLFERDPVALANAVHNSLEIKHSYIQEDEFDLGRRNILNYGHSVGHALESVSDFQIAHGQAVVLGMIIENKVSKRRGVLTASFEQQILNELLLPVLRFKPKPGQLELNAIVDAMAKDKKRTGQELAIILLKDGHNMQTVKDASVAEIAGALEETYSVINELGT